MKLKLIAYSVYVVFTILLSLTVASIPVIFLFLYLFESLEVFIDGIGWPFTPVRQWFISTFGGIMPSIAVDKFWFLFFLIPITFVCYGIFLGILLGMFLLSRKGIPYLHDGYHSVDDYMLLYEYYEVYYVIFPYFAWFFSVFLDTKPRHLVFGAKIGKSTIVGNGRLFNPERTVIGDNCFFGYDAIISGHVYEGDKLYLKTVKLGNCVTIGANAVILPGADIGDNVIVGANTVVPKDKVIPANCIWVRGKIIPRTMLEGEAGPDSRTLINGSKDYTPSEGEHV